jgi:hypothetical protein
LVGGVEGAVMVRTVHVHRPNEFRCNGFRVVVSVTVAAGRRGGRERWLVDHCSGTLRDWDATHNTEDREAKKTYISSIDLPEGA